MNKIQQIRRTSKQFQREGNRKLRRYAKKHNCSLRDAYKDVYGFDYKRMRG